MLADRNVSKWTKICFNIAGIAETQRHKILATKMGDKSDKNNRMDWDRDSSKKTNSEG